MTDHDLLIRMDEKLDALKVSFDNHLRHHARYTYLLLGITISAVISLIIALV